MAIQKFFHQTGVDISNPKSMFNFINEHDKYPTLNSWNGLYSIANNVKVYNLQLSGDPWVALNYLQSEDYDVINNMIYNWERKHKGYSVGFNGRSGGYLVLYNKDNMKSVVPNEIDGYETYEDFKEDCKSYGYKVSDFLRTLRNTTELIRDFDTLCDELRDYVDRLSNGNFNVDIMNHAVEIFNIEYEDDLATLGYAPLETDKEGVVNIGEIMRIKSLLNAFKETVQDQIKDSGYTCNVDLEAATAQITER